MLTKSTLWLILPPVSALLLTGCASTATMMREENPDPLEGYNRAVFTFNDKVDRAVIKPLAQAYEAVTPTIINNGVTNFFGNLGDVVIGVNNALQFKFRDAAIDLSRIIFNTTFGVLGFFDVASHMDLPKHNEDFGQTLGYWSGLEGYYFVVPFLGPSSTRDVFGIPVDYLTNPWSSVEPQSSRYSGIGVFVIDNRADLLRAERAFEGAAPDRYAFIRDAYIQRRRNLVYDGNPPKPQLDFDEFNGDDSQL